MNLRLFGFLGLAAAAAGVMACKEDPTASLATGAATLLVNPNPVIVNVGKTGSINANTFDALFNPVPSSFTATSGKAGTATVAPDNSAPDPNGTRQRYTVTGVSVNGKTADTAIVTVTAGSLTATDTVIVQP